VVKQSALACDTGGGEGRNATSPEWLARPSNDDVASGL